MEKSNLNAQWRSGGLNGRVETSNLNAPWRLGGLNGTEDVVSQTLKNLSVVKLHARDEEILPL